MALFVAVALAVSACDGAPDLVEDGSGDDPVTEEPREPDDAGASDVASQEPLSDREPLASIITPAVGSDALDEITVSVVSFENVGSDLLRMVLRFTPDRVPDDASDGDPGQSLSQHLGGNRATGINAYLTDPEGLREYRPVRTGTPNGTSRYFEGGEPIETVQYYGRIDGDPATVDVRLDPVVLERIQIEPIRDVPFDPEDIPPADPAGDGVLASMTHPITARDEADEVTISVVSFEPFGDEQMRMVLRFTPDRFPEPGSRATWSNLLGGGNAALVEARLIDASGLLEYRPVRAGARTGTSRDFDEGRPIDIAYHLPMPDGDPDAFDVRLQRNEASMDNVEPLRDVPFTLTEPTDLSSATPSEEDDEGVLTDEGTVLFDPAVYDEAAGSETGEDLQRFIDDLTPREPRDLAPETVEDDTTTVAVSADVLFAFASAELTDRAETTVRDLAARIDTDGPITVIGHTDSVGTDDVNQPLSEDRAEAVAAVLRDVLGDEADITVEGRGSDDPAVRETDDETAAQNRRVEISYGS